jgi:hypothetical protein
VDSAMIVLLGSSFCLFLFLNSPDFTNPYYVFGVGVMGFAIVFAALIWVQTFRTAETVAKRVNTPPSTIAIIGAFEV